MQSFFRAVFFVKVTEITLATLGNKEIGKNITPSNFSKVFNLPDTNREAGFYKLKTLSWSLDIGIFTTLFLQVILPL